MNEVIIKRRTHWKLTLIPLIYCFLFVNVFYVLTQTYVYYVILSTPTFTSIQLGIQPSPQAELGFY